jgi:hypothetical protein
MATDDHDPGADTATFRAYVEHPEPTTSRLSQRAMWIGAGLAVVLVALLVALLVA